MFLCLLTSLSSFRCNRSSRIFFFFFFNDTATTEIYTLSLHDALPICAGLGVVELTVALCYCFDSPRDKIVWDVGHQAYPWKILDRKSTRLNSSHLVISYAVFCLKKKKIGIEVQDRAAGDKVFAAELAE